MFYMHKVICINLIKAKDCNAMSLFPRLLD